MNILFDFITVSLKTGAGEYHRKVFFSLLDYISLHNINLKLYCLWDSTKGIKYQDLTPENFINDNRILFIDICKEGKFSSIIHKYQINKFFIACSHYIGLYDDIKEIDCQCICVIHDLCDKEFEENYLDIIVQLEKPSFYFNKKQDGGWKVYFNWNGSTMKFVRWLLGKRRRNISDNRMRNIYSLIKNNPNVSIITVSEYTRNSLSYYYDIEYDKISVFYSPSRIISYKSESSPNKELDNIINSGKKYYLMVNAGRGGKNPHKMLRAFERFSRENKNCYILTIGCKYKMFKNHLILPFLNDYDLDKAYKNCYALLYPSYFEGFGYPPIEAMKYGKPIMASNVTSIPEILGNSAIYFSPFFVSDIYKALKQLNENNYHLYTEKSKQQYNLIHSRQETDLNKLIVKIISNEQNN